MDTVTLRLGNIIFIRPVCRYIQNRYSRPQPSCSANDGCDFRGQTLYRPDIADFVFGRSDGRLVLSQDSRMAIRAEIVAVSFSGICSSSVCRQTGSPYRIQAFNGKLPFGSAACHVLVRLER